MPDYELLEMILFRVYRRGDTKPIAKRLVAEFGSFAEVLNASEQRLKEVDGVGDAVRLQHALGVAFHDGKLYVADTYNSKLKVMDPEKRTCTTFIPNSSGWFTGPTFHEPAGLSYANGKLYVADTNAHRIRVVDLKTKAVTTLPLSGVEAPKPKS